MEPLLEKELEQAAKRRGISKSQFIIDAVERSLGRKNPYDLMLSLKAEEQRPEYQAVAQAYQGWEQPYDTDASRVQLLQRLKAKHGSSVD
jgi:RHH-type rel operon transcriptional repressor/antitoxin RelB